MELLYLVLKFVLLLSGTFCTGLGLLTIYYWVKPAKKPADTSNRINNIASWWIGLTRQDVLATSYKYFQQDVMDNIEDVGEAIKMRERGDLVEALGYAREYVYEHLETKKKEWEGYEELGNIQEIENHLHFIDSVVYPYQKVDQTNNTFK